MFHDDALASEMPAAQPMEEPAEEPRREWQLLDLVLGGLLLMMGVAVVLAITFGAASVGLSARRDPGAALLFAIVTLAFEAWAGVAVLLVVRRRGLSLRDLGFVLPASVEAHVRWWSYVLFAVMGGYLAQIAYVLVMWVIEQLTGADVSRFTAGNRLPDELRGSPAVWVVLGLSVMVAAPLGEELFFRGLVFRALGVRLPLWLAFLVSGFAFALMHFNIAVVVPFTIIGMIFAWAYRASGSLWTTVAAHAIFNTVSFVVTILKLAP